MKDVDAVVIGSGAGGLAAAVALARAGKSVCVLEQHDVPGGWCHSFQLSGYQYSPGIHYLGQLGRGGRLRQLLEGLDVARYLTFLELNPDGYEHCLIGSERFDFPRGRMALADRLKRRFPQEAAGIDAFLSITQNVNDQLQILGEGESKLGALLRLPVRAPELLRYGLRSLRTVLETRISNPLLRGILSIQCGDHGLAPSRVPFVQHAAIMGHYFDGAYYPRGGGSAIAKAFTRGLEKAHGTLRLRTSVAQILIERGRAIGVILSDGTTLRAKHVISNADPHVTLRRLIQPEHLSPTLRRKLDRTRYSVSALSLFLALDINLRERGLDSGNYWYSDTPSMDTLYTQMAAPNLLGRERPPGLFLSVSSLKDPSSHRRTDHSTIEAFTFVPYSPFLEFQGPTENERRGGYAAFKRKLLAQMIRGVEQIVSQASRHVVFADLGTPLTNVYYCRSTQGNIYGTEKTLAQLGPWSFGVTTEIEQLYLCGASTLGHGLLGAASSGVQAAAAVLGVRPRELLTPATQTCQVFSSESFAPRSRWHSRHRPTEDPSSSRELAP